ncbi:MAG: lamin tail domain-containing protein, partial [Planctomycetales bacterium]
REKEQVTLVNPGDQPVSLAGWTLQDESGARWKLDSAGVLGPGKRVVIVRGGQAMALNNDGDAVSLIDPFGEIIHQIAYGKTKEGESVVVE